MVERSLEVSLGLASRLMAQRDRLAGSLEQELAEQTFQMHGQTAVFSYEVLVCMLV